MDISEQIDRAFELRKARLALQKDVDKMKDEEDGLIAAIGSELEACELDEYSGSLGTVRLKTSESAEVTDYHALYEYIRETNSFDLLQKRVSLAGARERWQEGNEVPGVARVLETKAVLGKL